MSISASSIGRPTAVRVSVACWLLAVAAGVFETILVATGAGDDSVTGAALWAGVTVRGSVFLLAIILSVKLARGSTMARWMLTVLLGILGLASIVVPALASYADGHSILDSFRDEGRLPLTFAISRIAHVAAVVVATVSMWLPARADREFIADPSR